ncbi:MAG: VOC family protein [Oscillospiraceae bacterium]|jgi:lactoylglutathione lyase|nr:VOC family protein [Oscillospiraceae bacterium]
MTINHMAVYVTNLEAVRAFYETYFDATSNALYHNPNTGLKTYFLSFKDGARLEIMHRSDVRAVSQVVADRLGYAHLALGVGSREAVDRLTARLKSDGFAVLKEPRTTGDGYYESCVLDVEGNVLEIVAEYENGK